MIFGLFSLRAHTECKGDSTEYEEIIGCLVTQKENRECERVA